MVYMRKKKWIFWFPLQNTNMTVGTTHVIRQAIYPRWLFPIGPAVTPRSHFLGTGSCAQPEWRTAPSLVYGHGRRHLSSPWRISPRISVRLRTLLWLPSFSPPPLPTAVGCVQEKRRACETSTPIRHRKHCVKLGIFMECLAYNMLVLYCTCIFLCMSPQDSHREELVG